MVSTFILAALYAAAGGLSPRKKEDPSKSRLVLKIRGWELNLLPFLIMLAAVEIIVFLDKLTYAAYIDTPQAFLFYLLPFLGIGMVYDLTGRAATYHARRFLLLLTLALLFSSYLAPGLAPLGPEAAMTVVLLLLVAVVSFLIYKLHDAKSKFGMVYAGLTVFALLVPTVLAATAAPYASQNPLFNSLQSNQTDGPPAHYLQNSSEVRVISWELATAYLHRAYGDAASYLDTDDSTLAKYTDPTMLNGRFVWANAPVFESLKWLGDRDHPAFVYIENVPENMSREDPNVLHKVYKNLDYHMTRIEWSKRLHQKLFDKYSDFLLVQSRFDIDDALNPYMVLYLATQPSWFALPTLQKIVIVDLSTGVDVAYAVTDPTIPAWLEVVYPDSYVYEWLNFWAHNRFGWGYSVVNKQHIYEPDDVSARFILLEGHTYWQLPLVQKDAQVLGGYALVDTRTGNAVFYNREVLSYADMETATTQVMRYLTSGELGFQHLDIHEGYLYPFLLESGARREAYVFPLYAGFSILKYAILDAQEYTSPPVIADSLSTAVKLYSGHSFGTGNGTGVTLKWESHAIQNAYIGQDPSSSKEEAVLTLNNTTTVVTAQQLRGGLLAQGDDEWRELSLAVAEFQRTGNVTLWVTIRDSEILDVDWEGATLVKHN